MEQKDLWKPEAVKMQELLKKRYDLYVDAIREERDKDMCREYYGKVCGMLDFAMELGLIDFAESFCMYSNINKVADESFSQCEDSLDILRNAIKSGEIPVLYAPAFKEKDVEYMILKVVGGMIREKVIIRPEASGLHK